MKLKDLDFAKLLPHFMQDDLADIGLSKGVDDCIRPIEARISTLSTWDKIDSLTEEELDALAWELNAIWYRQDAPIDVKRQLIKDSRQMSRKLGTKWAVERIINTYFGDGFITEWFEYDGQPGHFRVYSANPSITEENLQEFLSILAKVKRASAHLDGIIISLTGRMFLAAGLGYHETTFETIAIGGRKPV